MGFCFEFYYNKLKLMAEDYKFQALTMQHIKEACHNMSQSFIKANTIYIKRESTYEQVYPVYYYELEESIKHDLCYGVFHHGKIVGVIISHDMYDYPKMQNKAWLQGDSKIVSYERRFVQDIQSELLKSNFERGLAVYCIYYSTLPEHGAKGVGLMLARGLIKQLQRKGFRQIYGTATSERSFNVFGRFDITILRQMECKEPGMEGERYTYAVVNIEKSLPADQGIKKTEIKPRL